MFDCECPDPGICCKYQPQGFCDKYLALEILFIATWDRLSNKPCPDLSLQQNQIAITHKELTSNILDPVSKVWNCLLWWRKHGPKPEDIQGCILLWALPFHFWSQELGQLATPKATGDPSVFSFHAKFVGTIPAGLPAWKMMSRHCSLNKLRKIFLSIV